ncbi:MAG: O-antigen ligase family protein [Pseudomonadota bacterium]
MTALRPFAQASQIYLLMAVCFVLPMRVSYVYLLSALLLLAVLFSGGFHDRLRGMIRSRSCRLAVAYFGVVLLAMLWTENHNEGWHFVGRHLPFLLFALYWTVAEVSSRERCLNAFVAGLVTCALLAHYNWLQHYYFPDWPRGIRVFKSAEDTAPFVDRIMYAPILALGSYIALERLLSKRALPAIAGWSVLVVLLMSNLAFSGGRAGMVAFAAMFVVMIFQRFSSWPRALAVSTLAVMFSFSALHTSSGYFRERADEALNDLRTFKTNHHSSVGERLIYWTTSAQVFSEHPLIGVGSGDFKAEYVKARATRWADTPDSYNPHNQFLMTGVTTGLLGLGVLIAFLVSIARASDDRRTVVLMCGFLVACLFESYLWRSNTSLTFMVLMALLARSSVPGERSVR